MMYSLGHDVFPVDVNVQRVAARVGAIPHGLKHYQAQQRLPPLIPPGRSEELHVGMVVLGRDVCLARNPQCNRCPIQRLCAMGQKVCSARRGQSTGRNRSGAAL
jgi:endonuclease-3